MKFGHDLPRNQVPEWASSYINYKGLKRLIKAAAEAVQHGTEPDLAGKYHVPSQQYTYQQMATSIRRLQETSQLVIRAHEWRVMHDMRDYIRLIWTSRIFLFPRP